MSRNSSVRLQFDDLIENIVQMTNGLNLSGSAQASVQPMADKSWAIRQDLRDNSSERQSKDMLTKFPRPLTLLHRLDDKVQIELTNPAFRDLTGYDSQEVLSRDHRFLMADETNLEKAERIEQALREQRQETVELRNNRKNGDTFWNRQTIVPLPKVSKTGNYHLCLHQDITEVRGLKEGHNNQAQFMKDVNSNLSGVMFQFRKKPAGGYRITKISDGFKDLAGMSAEQAMDEVDQVLSQVHSDDLKALQFSIDASASSMSTWECEFRFVRPDGTVKWVRGSSEPEAESNGDITWSGVLIDITKRKELEQRLKQQVHEKKQVNQQKTDVLATATHDLRTPLNTILGMSSTLQKTDLSSEQNRDLDCIRIAAKSMLFLVNDILDLDRMETGQLELHPEPIEIRALIYQVLMLFRPKINGSNLTVSENVEDSVPKWVNVDSDRLKRVIINIMDNAFTHTKDGRIELEVSCLSQSTDQTTIQFSISDTGPGIPDDERKTIFQERQQADTGDSAEETGAGLGLSICQSLVQRMNGDIHVESEMGVGSTFTFSVQLDVPSPEQIPEDGETKDTLDGSKVLVVDDNAHIRKLTRRFLEDANIDVTTIGTKDEAEEQLTDVSQERFDTVFLDRRLSNGSGLDIIQHLQEQEQAFDTRRIFILTGDPESDVLKHVSEDEIAGVINKPVSEETLLNSIRRTADASRSGTTTDTSIKRALRTRLEETRNRILIVDNAEQARRILRIYLKPVTDHIDAVSNGEEAVKLHQERPPGIILMDFEMPGMNGIKTTEKIREIEARKGLARVPIVFQTALAMESSKQKYLSAGADGFIEKPIDPEALFRIIHGVLDESGE